jgi:hypothetical protein
VDRANSQTAFHLIREECEVRNAGLILTSLNKTDLPDPDLSLKL